MCNVTLWLNSVMFFCQGDECYECVTILHLGLNRNSFINNVTLLSTMNALINVCDKLKVQIFVAQALNISKT